MSGFRPLNPGLAPGFVPLAPQGADGGEAAAPAVDFVPLFGSPSRPAPPPPPAAAAPPRERPDDVEADGPDEEPAPEEAEDIATLRARDEGFALGHAEGLAAGQAEIAERLAQLDGLIRQLGETRADLFRRSVADMGDAIRTIAERIVRRELAVDSSGVQRLVVQVLDHVQSDDEVVIRIAPEDERQMRNAAPAVLDQLGREATFRIEVDPGLQPGGAIVQTQLGSIDASVGTQFAAFAESVADWVTEEAAGDAG